MSLPSAPSLPFRPCVGLCLLNREGKVFVGERIDSPGAWQMPQGGIDPGEDIQSAALRELREEIGTDKAEILRVHNQVIRYSIPDEVLQRLKLWNGKYAGQDQTWVALRFTGSEADIRLDADDHPEFSRYQWVSLKETVGLIVPFKRDVYTQVCQAFADLAA